MEMQCFDDSPYWDSIGSLPLEDLLFLPECVSNNWDPGHELGTKFTNVPPCGEGKGDSPSEKPCDVDLFDGLDLSDVGDAEFHDWMEMKFDLTDTDVLETLNSLTEEKFTQELIDNPASENLILPEPSTSDTILPSVLSTAVDLTPPDSPQDSKSFDSKILSPTNSKDANSSHVEFPMSVTPPETPPHNTEEIIIYPDILVKVEDIADIIPKPDPSEASTSKATLRRKPYSRGRPSAGRVKEVLDKKEKKRDQNRDAATRYRLKKREEATAMSREELELKTKNKELQDKVDNLSNEIKYLKNLLKEVVVARAQAKK